MEGQENVAFELSEPSTSCSSVCKCKRRSAVVAVRDANKSYTKGVPVLSSFNMTVEKGTIYALLGSSGCGKTTLLSCIIGVQQLSSGSICVFGKKPGDSGLGIPGQNVGYMPQDIVLYEDFTVKEALYFYGALYCMTAKDIRNNSLKLTTLLDLSNKDRQIKLLSGGQKRRVSMAVSMIHSPRLLILDEPTVGVDPILRESIWKHLLDRVAKFHTTVIITTHYIEEAKNANTIGIIRDGKLLAEDTPQSLLKQHKVTLLEHVVMNLCKQDAQSGHSEFNVTKLEMHNLEEITHASLDDVLETASSYTHSIQRTLALALKNGMIVWKNILFLVFFLFVPVATQYTTPYFVGRTPRSLDLAVVNQELISKNLTNCNTILQNLVNCSTVGSSCLYLSLLPSEIIKLKYYTNEDYARRSVKKGKNWGYILVPENFSQVFHSRVINRAVKHPSDELWIHLDESNRVITGTLHETLVLTFQAFTEQYFVSCGYSKRLVEPGLVEDTPVYPSKDLLEHKTMFVSSTMILLLFFFPSVATGVQYIIEKMSGANERAFVAGAQQWEILGGFLLSTSVIVLVQTGLQLFVAMVIHDVEIEGSIFLFVVLCLLTGVSGVSLGYLLGQLCSSPEQVGLLTTALLWPVNTMSGMASAAEGMPKGFWYASYCFPTRWAIDTIRSIVSRGWGFDHEKIWPGFASLMGWTLVYWVLSVAIAKLKTVLK